MTPKQPLEHKPWTKKEIIDDLTKIAKERHHRNFDDFVASICKNPTWCGCKEYKELLSMAGVEVD